MKKFILAFLIGCMLALPIQGGTEALVGEDLTFNVVIPEECEVGELVRMSADGDVEGIKWEIRPQTSDFEVIDEGRRAFFSGRGPGEFLLIVVGAKGGLPYLHYQTLTVRGDPTPVSELTAKVGEWLKRLPADVDKSKIKQVASVFRKLANSDTAVGKMLEATALANSAVIGDELDKWIPFLDGLGAELDALVAAKKLDTRDQYRATWLEIATALERGV